MDCVISGALPDDLLEVDLQDVFADVAAFFISVEEVTPDKALSLQVNFSFWHVAKHVWPDFPIVHFTLEAVDGLAAGLVLEPNIELRLKASSKSPPSFISTLASPLPAGP